MFIQITDIIVNTIYFSLPTESNMYKHETVGTPYYHEKKKKKINLLYIHFTYIYI